MRGREGSWLEVEVMREYAEVCMRYSQVEGEPPKQEEHRVPVLAVQVISRPHLATPTAVYLPGVLACWTRGLFCTILEKATSDLICQIY